MLARSREKELREKKQFDEYHNTNNVNTLNVHTFQGGAPGVKEGGVSEEMLEMMPQTMQTRGRGGRMSGRKFKTAMHTAAMPMHMPPALGAEASYMQESADSAADLDSMSAPSPPSSPFQQQQHQQQHQQQQQQGRVGSGRNSGGGSGYDFTSLPQRLQDVFEQDGGGSTLRPTIVTVRINTCDIKCNG